MSGESKTANGCLTDENSAGFNRGIEMFFARNGFDDGTREECDKYARFRFPHIDSTPSTLQGYCSYTLALLEGYLLQFRPEAFKLNMDICNDAKTIFQRYAPATTYMGVVQGIPLREKDAAVDDPPAVLHVYLQERIPGIPLSEFRRRRGDSSGDAKSYRRRLVVDLARVFALGFHQRRFQGGEAGLARIPKGKVGASLSWRLNLLKGLPGERLAQHVSQTQQQLHALESSPWCLTHGDLFIGNMMVNATSGHLTGLIDWAEAEWLPFGMALYGVEEVLGRDVPPQGFQYYQDHQELRRLFWEKLLVFSRRRDPGIRPWLEEVELSRRLGVLLWRGIAFDDGKMDRVVEAGRDDSELQRLVLFLEAPSALDGLSRNSLARSWLQQAWS